MRFLLNDRDGRGPPRTPPSETHRFQPDCGSFFH